MGVRRLGLALAFWLALAWPALAQTEMLAGYAGRGVRGVEAAKGAVIWSHGLALVAETSSEPPLFVDQLHDAGWDVYRLARRWAGDNFADSTEALAEQAAKLRADGYKRVVLAGQSFGAWISYAVAARPTLAIDAVIATAPARFGTEAVSQNWRFNAERLYPLVRDIKSARVLTFLFEKDDFDPGGRGPALSAIFKERGLPHLVIDRPAGFEGHSAAGSHAFGATFGPCVVAFVELEVVPADFTCDAVPAAKPEAGFVSFGDLKVVPPPRDAAAGFADYSGRWHGFAPTGQAVMLIVYRMGTDRALAVYAWTAKGRPGPNDRPGASGRRGEFDPATRTLRFQEPRRVRIEASLRPDGKLDMTLANSDGNGTPLALVLRKLD